jgi:hypothetical protein
MGAEAAAVQMDEGLTGDAFDLAFEAAAGVGGDIVDIVAPPADPEPPKVEVAPVVEPPKVEAAPLKVEVPNPAVEVAKVAEASEAAEAVARESLSEDETKQIEAIAKDFPEVLEAMNARERVLLAKMENQFAAKLAELTSQFDTKLTPALTTAQNYATNQFMASVLQNHADAVTLLPKVEEWITTQPSFLAKAYNAVLDSGTVAETVELYNLFKKETVIEAAAEPSPEEAIAQQDKEKRLKAQEGVKGRHTSGGRAAVDPDDFDGAFDKFAATA